jgi:tRNA A37 N6-isopentenylltransferase MiaA
VMSQRRIQQIERALDVPVLVGGTGTES